MLTFINLKDAIIRRSIIMQGRSPENLCLIEISKKINHVNLSQKFYHKATFTKLSIL